MNDKPISSIQFRHAVEESSSILTANGFKRAMQFENETPTTTSVVYLGINVAFTFTFDHRDQLVDLMVTRHRDGKLIDNWEGGYSSSLFAHLVNHCGFRGNPTSPNHPDASASKLHQMISSQMCLFSHPSSAILLTDRIDSLPN